MTLPTPYVTLTAPEHKHVINQVALVVGKAKNTLNHSECVRVAEAAVEAVREAVAGVLAGREGRS